MAEFTKEQLIAEVHYNLEHCFCSDKTKRLMEIALAALTAGMEQGPVAWRWRQNESKPWHLTVHSDCAGEVQPLYAAPQLPQPAVVPDAIEIDDDFDSAFEHGKAVGWNAYRAAMLQGAEPVSQPYRLRDGWVAVPVDMTPEQMRAVQINSELGAYASTNLSGAYSLFREFWGVAVKSAPNQEAE